jgi:hypothetical protein
MCALAGEVADGLRLHPVCTPAYIDDAVRPAVAHGASRAGRDAGEVEICMKPLVGTAPDAARLERVVTTVRERASLRASEPALRRVSLIGAPSASAA